MTDPLSAKHRTREQMPGFLAKFDDPYGISWRVANAFRRIDPARTWRFIRAWLRPHPLRAPILIVGMPRSGTQFLFHLLRESPLLGAMPREGHDAWRKYHHPRHTTWQSDRVAAGQLKQGERRFIKAWFRSFCGDRRLVEKTAENLLRIPYLLELFPDARFIAMKRNPCDVLNSYINMWRHPQGRFRSYFVPATLQIPGYPHRHQWTGTLIEGWRSLTSSSVPQIAFAQWLACVDGLEEARRLVPAGQWAEFHLEDLLENPGDTISDVYRHIGITPDAGMARKLDELLANPINAMSPAGHEKWRTGNAEEIRQLLPEIARHAPRLGYVVDPSTGTVRLAG